jgi:hypothetical protein
MIKEGKLIIQISRQTLLTQGCVSFKKGIEYKEMIFVQVLQKINHLAIAKK